MVATMASRTEPTRLPNEVQAERQNEPPTRVLVVEDEAHLAQVLQFNLSAEGYDVEVAGDGESALRALEAGGPAGFSVVLLDVMLPGKNGFAVVQELRQRQNFVPVMMLTARGRPEDVLEGFAAGADDYLAKPFDLSILLARLNGLLRRMTWQRAGTPPQPVDDSASDDSAGAEAAMPSFSFAGRTIDFDALQLHALDKIIRLTLMEGDLLRYLARNHGRIVSRKELLEQVWRVHEDTDTRAIDNFIVRLRRYIEDDPSHPVYLQTVRGVGYRFLPATTAGVTGAV